MVTDVISQSKMFTHSPFAYIDYRFDEAVMSNLCTHRVNQLQLGRQKYHQNTFRKAINITHVTDRICKKNIQRRKVNETLR